ncbi:MBOAT family O-acyltransferase [Okeania sp. SIO2C2]|uniref:MBOAT family O-acyltransferase n=1 Tax=Okeania sp. SIO2C2 TaxID=2607787 RepID=UPI0035C8C226
MARPILRHDELIPQFRQLRNFIFSQKNMALGLSLFSLGLCKKVLIADTISPWVVGALNNAYELSFIEAWVGALSYTFQLYFDFSGYSDMAIGLGLMFNIKLPINFNSPYKATSISDFWRRWHITLSNFLRDYLYIPLGGSRRGEVRRYSNLLTTMLLGGLWHGAGWTYVIWGGLHGVYVSINHWWRKLNIPMPKVLAWVITFVAVIVSWVLFRAQNIQDGLEILQTMAGLNGVLMPGEAKGKLSVLTNFGFQLKSWSDMTYLPELWGSKIFSILGLIGLTFSVSFLPNTQEILAKLKPTWWWAVWIGILTRVIDSNKNLPNNIFDGENGFIPYLNVDPKKTKSRFEKIMGNYYVGYHTTYQLSTQLLDEFKKVVDLCQQNKIKLISYISPAHATQWEIIKSSGQWSTFEEWKRKVVEISDVFDFYGYNSITTEPIHNNMENYTDNSHYTPKVGNLILNRLLSYKKEEVPEDFGILINSENIESHLIKIRQDREIWVKNHPNEVNLVKEIKQKYDAKLAEKIR